MYINLNIHAFILQLTPLRKSADVAMILEGTTTLLECLQ